MYQRILVPVDGSAPSDRGLAEAIGSDAERILRLAPVPVLLVRGVQGGSAS